MKKGCLLIFAIILLCFASLAIFGKQWLSETSAAIQQQDAQLRAQRLEKQKAQAEAQATSPEKQPASPAGQGIDRNSKDYEEGYRSGYIVGKADARDGRQRRGMWASQHGIKLAPEGYDAKTFGKGFHEGFHEGYNEGFHARKHYQERLR